MNNNLNRFLEAQKNDYSTALSEIKAGKKTSHWMWYIFPQIAGLGHSSTAVYYAIKDKDEAENYLSHEILGQRLIEISEELLKLEINDAVEVFGYTDKKKLKSCMSLFSLVSEKEKNVFNEVLDKYFEGKIDFRTKKILEK